MSEEACPRDLPEQGVQPRISMAVTSQGQPSPSVRVDEQHDTNPDTQ